MSFERKSLQGPNGVVIRGPEEHKGESRYHWLEEVGILKPRTEMILRIEKSYSTVDYDCHSPIIHLRFKSEGLLIRLDNSQKLQHGNLRAFINPYRNALAVNSPSFLIGTEHWIENQNYHLKYETNPWGDFLVFELQLPVRNGNLDKQQHQLLLINLWAIFGLAGLGQIHSNGIMYFYSEKLGQVPTKNGECLPFFADITVPGDFNVTLKTFRDFQQRSTERALAMFRQKVVDGISVSISADIFNFIGESAYGDRPSTTPEEGLRRAKKAFVKLFSEAV